MWLEADGEMANEARKLVWMGAIPLQLQLDRSEVTTLPPPPPSLILAPRNGYLPLLVPVIKPHFQSALPIGQDTGWFDYRGLPLKWHIPIGVLFDLLCFEPERPWNLTVHFRGYPSDLIPYDGEDVIKWSFINSLKEASYIMYGSTKNVMNLSQSEQLDLWQSVVKGDFESYTRVSFKLKPHVFSSPGIGRSPSKLAGDEEAASSTTRAGREFAPLKVPFRLYVRTIQVENEDMLKALPVESWDDIAYITRPVDVSREDGGMLTLWDALVKIAPHLFAQSVELATGDQSIPIPLIWEGDSVENVTQICSSSTNVQPSNLSFTKYFSLLRGQKPFFRNGILRIQGIEPSPDLPIDWIAQNLCGLEQFVHVCMTILHVSDFEKKVDTD